MEKHNYDSTIKTYEIQKYIQRALGKQNHPPIAIILTGREGRLKAKQEHNPLTMTDALFIANFTPFAGFTCL